MLNTLVWLPVLGGLALLVLGRAGVADMAVRWAALGVAGLVLLMGVILWFAFDRDTAAMQFAVDVPWIEAYSINYALGVDGFSMPLVVLNTFVTFLTVAAGWVAVRERVPLYMAAFLLMCGFVNGVFAATDAILFYVFWEATLIPLFLVIASGR